MIFDNYVAIAGPIGAGKTTLATLLADRLGGQAILERMDEVPGLAAFYTDPSEHALAVQVAFLLSRSRLLRTAGIGRNPGTMYISDYFFEKELVFTRLNLSGADLEAYREQYARIAPLVPRPGNIVYLKASAETLARRIKKRGIAYEKPVKLAYLRRLVKGYRELMGEYEGVIEIDTEASRLTPKSPAVVSLIEQLRP